MIDKSLNQAPAGLESLAQDEEPIEIEIVDPESVSLKMNGLEITLEEGEDSDERDDPIHFKRRQHAYY